MQRGSPFEAVFDHLATLGWSRMAREHGYEGTLAWLRERCRERRDKHVTLLDLGCADGQVSALLASEGLRGHFTGVDLSSKMLDAARARGIYAELRQVDLAVGIHDPGPARFDIVCAIGVFEYLPDVQQLLREVRSVCAPGAELWATFHAPPAPDIRAKWPEWRRGALCWHTPEQARAVLQQAGWRVLSLEQRVAGDAVASDPATGLRSLGWSIEYVFVRATPAD